MLYPGGPLTSLDHLPGLLTEYLPRVGDQCVLVGVRTSITIERRLHQDSVVISALFGAFDEKNESILLNVGDGSYCLITVGLNVVHDDDEDDEDDDVSLETLLSHHRRPTDDEIDSNIGDDYDLISNLSQVNLN